MPDSRHDNSFLQRSTGQLLHEAWWHKGLKSIPSQLDIVGHSSHCQASCLSASQQIADNIAALREKLEKTEAEQTLMSKRHIVTLWVAVFRFCWIRLTRTASVTRSNMKRWMTATTHYPASWDPEIVQNTWSHASTGTSPILQKFRRNVLAATLLLLSFCLSFWNSLSTTDEPGRTWWNPWLTEATLGAALRKCQWAWHCHLLSAIKIPNKHLYMYRKNEWKDRRHHIPDEKKANAIKSTTKNNPLPEILEI